jgi:hypothetical protein
MESYTDIIVLTSIVVVLFLVFIIATAREFTKMSNTSFIDKDEKGPRADLIRFIGKLFNDDSISPAKKVMFMNSAKSILDGLEEHYKQDEGETSK